MDAMQNFCFERLADQHSATNVPPVHRRRG